MSRQISGQYTIQSSNTSEEAINGKDLKGNLFRLYNAGDNAMHIGNDGGDSVDDTTGFSLGVDDTQVVRLDDSAHGNPTSLYVYGTSGDTLEWIVTA